MQYSSDTSLEVDRILKAGNMTIASELSKIFLVTGASRGLGLEFVRQLAAVERNFIFAAVRNPDSAFNLKAIQEKSNGRVELVTMDVSDTKSIVTAGKVVKAKTKKLDVLINNAGIATTIPNSTGLQDSTPTTTPKNMLEVFKTNVISVQVVTQTFLPLLRAAEQERKDGKLDKKSPDVPKVINITSDLASIEKNWGTYTAYRVSKTALNMLTVNWAIDYPDIAFIPQAPGWVDTELGRGGGKPPLTPEQSIRGMLELINKTTLESSGKFINWDGSPLLW